MAMGTSRMLDQNAYYWITSGLAHGIPGQITEQDWGDTKVVAGYPNNPASMALPTVSVYRTINTNEDLELGSSNVTRKDSFVASVFAERNGQRDDISEYVKRLVDTRTKSFLDFNDGFPPQEGQTSLGTLRFLFVNMIPVRNLQPQTRASAHRMDVRFDIEYIYDVSA